MWRKCNGRITTVGHTMKITTKIRFRLLLGFRAMPLLLQLVLIASCSYAMEYSAKLSSCYDMKYGFNELMSLNDSKVGSTSGINGKTTTTTTTTTNVRLDPDGGSDGNSNGIISYLNRHQLQQEQLPVKISDKGNVGGGDSMRQGFDQATSPPADGFTINRTAAVSTQFTGWKCCCWNATNQDEIECRCEGEALTRVPQTLKVPMQRLTITSAGLPRLRNTGLKIYANSLLDIVMTDLKQLDCIQDGAFASLKLLRTIYISHAPKLTYLSKDVFFGISDTIKIIRIINSGLMQVPDLIHLPSANILQMLDLDNNHINRIEKKSISIKTDQLILANNVINYIDDSAFSGSQIARLILKENRKLREIHPNAFNGVSIQELDLSGTSLVRLPSVGLQDVEELRIQNTHTLKTIPSIYNFKNLQRAYLTHSFHCCAFKFPSRHDPHLHAERMKELEKWQRQCKAKVNSGELSTADNENSKLNRIKFEKTDDSDSDNGNEQKNDNNDRHGAMPDRFSGIVYSRLQRSHFDVSSDGNQYETGFAATAAQGSVNNRPDGGVRDENGVDDGIDPYADVEMIDDNNYFSEAMNQEIGIFHEEITINPDEQLLEEYCGNLTSRKREVECYPIPDALNPCEDVMGYQWLRMSVWVVVALAVVGNIAVLVVILSIKPETTSVPRFLMGHLAFADLCLGLYLLCIASIDAHSKGSYFNYAYDWQYGAGCKVSGFLTVFASHLSVFTLTVITIERWLAITRAMQLNKRIKLRAASYIMCGGWIYSIVMSMLPLFGISNYSSTSICLPMENRDIFDTIYLICILGLNGIAFVIIAICYSQIYMSLGKETRHARHDQPRELSIAHKMALLVFTNFSCWAPIAFFGLTALAGYPLINVTKSKILLVFFYPLNSCADPYLYAILTSQYRQDFSTLLAKFGICKETAMKYKSGLSLQGTSNFSVRVSSTQRHNSLVQKTDTEAQVQQHILPPENELMLKNHKDFV